MTDSPRSFREAFFRPPREYSPVPIWWWSGEPLDPSRLKWQLERFAEGGVFNVVILNLAASGPIHGSDADDPPFFSPEWWRVVLDVCAHARELGVSLWLYDQIGFSGAGIQAGIVSGDPQDAGQWLERVEATLDGRGKLLPPAGCRAIAATAFPAGGPPVAVDVDGQVARWEGDGSCRLVLFYAVTRGFDYLKPEACDRLLDRVHGEMERRLGEHLGTTVVGTFQDELPSVPTWSERFATEFADRNGYDLRSHLADLFEDVDPGSSRVRRDYHATRAALAEEAFFTPLARWHERHGLLVGCDQQDPSRAGHPVESVAQYGDYLRTHRWFGAPGSDHHGDAHIHSSLAHIYNRQRAWIEAFHSTGWGGTLEETFDWLLPWLRAGATLYNPHASYYSTRGGWWEWAPPATDWRQPYWRHYRVFADAVTRLCASLSTGSHSCDVGVLFPTTTVQAGARMGSTSVEARRAHDIYLELVGDMTWFHTVPGTLDRLGRDFDVLDENSVARATISGGQLRIAYESYAAVILPACTMLDSTVAAQLIRFIEAGGRVVAVGEQPRASVDGDGTWVARLADRFAAADALIVPNAEALGPALACVPPRVDADVPTLVRDVEGNTLVFATAAAPRATEVRAADSFARGAGQGWARATYDFEPSRYARKARIRVRNASGPVTLFEPFSGHAKDVPFTESGQTVEAEVTFEDGPAALLVFGESGIEPERAAAVVDAGCELDPAWVADVVPTLDNRWGDFGRPATTGEMPVDRWEVRHRTERGDEAGVRAGWAAPDHDDSSWAWVTATFGPHARATALPASPSDQAGEEWRDVVWSLSRGIRKDALHQATLGPKGHVPEEFLDFGELRAGAGVHVHFHVDAPSDTVAFLAVGAPAAKRAWVGEDEVRLGDPGYLAIGEVRLAAGVNRVDVQLTVEEDARLRAHIAFVTDPTRYRRPEWIESRSPSDELFRVARVVTLPVRPTETMLQVAATAPCRVLVNGQEAGRQGGFDPYFERASAQISRYDPSDLLGVGDNEVALELTGHDARPAVLVDGVLHCDGGPLRIVSDRHWQHVHDDGTTPVALRRRQWRDPGWTHLWRRPHPLADANWLEGTNAGVVLPLAPAARLDRSVEWVRFELPPGATAVHLAVHGTVTAFVDGCEVTRGGPAAGNEPHRLTVDVAATARRDRRVCALRVDTQPAWRGGAVLAEPVRFDMGPGVIRLGDWEEQGLRGYSGGVRYGTTLRADPEVVRSQQVALDLGHVRGTAEVAVNGRSAGARVCSPYRFELTGLLHPEGDVLEITVFNTLAPYLDATSPTHFVFPGQRASGLFGPVRLEWATG